jgi:hypothetical protein
LKIIRHRISPALAQGSLKFDTISTYVLTCGAQEGLGFLEKAGDPDPNEQF